MAELKNESPRRFIRALKGRLGHYARPEGRDEPFRARVFAEPAPFAALRAGFQRTDHVSSPRPSLGHHRHYSNASPSRT